MSDLGELRARFRAEYGNPLDAANQYVGALEAKVERLNRFNDELAADKFRLLKEIRALDARIPDPDDLRVVLEAVDTYLAEDVHAPKEAWETVARLRATLEVKDE